MPAWSINLLEALQEIAEVENCLLDGYPPDVMHGKNVTKTALRVAADRMGIDPQSLRGRVGTPEVPGRIYKRWQLKVEWGLYKPRIVVEDYSKPEDIAAAKNQIAIERLTQNLKISNRRIELLQREEDTAELIRKKIYDLAEHTPEPPEWILRPGGLGSSRGVPITIWSDWHWGEVVRPEEVGGMNEFNEKIGRRRAKELVEKTVDLCTNHMGLSKMSYPGMIICLGGDMITGDIHEELMATNDRTPQQSINDLTDVLATSLDIMATKFGRIFVPCVVGNHGRSSRKPRMKGRVFTSYEWNIYCNLERYFKDNKHIQFMIPGETDAYFRIYNTRFLLTHGDSLGVKGGDGIIGAMGPVMRGAIKVGRSEAQIGRDFDMLLMGHYHQTLFLPSVTVNNSFIGYNEFARLNMRAPYSRPSQVLFFAHPEWGITARWEVLLEKLKSNKDQAWVQWQ